MFKNIIIKSLINGVLSFFGVVLIQILVKGMTFEAALTTPYTIVLAVSAVLGSFIGFTVKASK